MKRYLPVILLLSVFLLLAVTSAMQKSPICDEVAHHLASGYSYLKLRDFRMNPCTPPLARELAALPLLFMNLRLPLDSPSWAANDSPTFGKIFLYDNTVGASKILFWAKVPMILVSLFMGVLIFLWTDKIYGYKSAVFSLFLFTFCPNMLANAPLIMTDMSSAAFTFLALFTFWLFLKGPSKKNLCLAGISFGLAQLSKHSLVVLFPIYIVLGLIEAGLGGKSARGYMRAARSITLIFLIGLFVMWAGYLFELKPLLKNMPRPEEKVELIKGAVDKFVPFQKEKIKSAFVNFALNVPVPMSTYFYSLAGVIKAGVMGQRSYLFGEYSQTGWRHYYLVDFFLKTPLPLIIILFLVLIFRKRSANKDLLTGAFLFLPVSVFFLGCSLSHLQFGIRYLLPAYPFLFVLASDAVNFRFKRQAILAAALVILSAWYLIGNARVYPHYLAYINEAGGGPARGYKYIHDTDWGQDLPALKRYIDSNRIDKVKLYYFGQASPDYYKIPYERLTAKEMVEPQGGYYAISVQCMDEIQWAKYHRPLAKVGYTIFIYNPKTER